MFEPNQPKLFKTVFCFYCCKYLETHNIFKRVEPAFTVTDFRNWKRALESKKGFAKQQDLPEMMSPNLKIERKNNHDMLLKIISSTQFLGKFIL